MKIHLLLLFLFFHLTTEAQFYISEYSASNLDTHLDSFESAEDWVQITNGGNTPANIKGWHLSDKEDNPTKWSFPANKILEPNESIFVLCSGRPIPPPDELHATFKLSQTEGKDKLILASPDGTIIDNISMQITLKDHSRYRENANSDEWYVCTIPDPTSTGCFINNKNQYTAKPDIHQKPGYYDSTLVVSIQNNEPDSDLRYTIDGTKVIASSPIYTGPISIHNTAVVKARAFSMHNEILPGKMDFATFFINQKYSLPIFSIAGNQLIQLANGNGGLIPFGSIEYFTPDGERQSTSYGELNRHGKGSWANDQRSLDYICRDEMGYTKAIKGKLFKTRKREEFQRLMFRASGDDNYPTSSGSAESTHLRDEYVHTLAYENGLELDCRTVQRAILFLNGQYWGVYGLREKVADNDYTKEYYDQDKFEIEFITHWGGPTVRYGENSLQSWTELRDFILNEDMSVEANYKRVDDELNLTSLIDYFAANTNTVSTDWLDWNTGWWRGLNPDGKHKKWGYILWDMDATFGYFINWIGLPNTSPDALPCDIDNLSLSLSWGEHEDILYKLIEENEDFRNMYFSRYADIANSAFSCETMLETLDRLEGEIDTEMPRQMERWGGSYALWKGNVDDLRSYVEERCDLIHESLVECHEELTEIHDITLLTEPDGIGEIDFSTLDIETFPWQGMYYGGMVYDIKAKVFDEYEDDYVFSHWESESGNIILPDGTSRKAKYTVNESDVLVAVFTVKTSTEEASTDYNWTAFPNPTTGRLSINYTLEQVSDVEIYLTNTVGQRVGVLKSNGASHAGEHLVTSAFPSEIAAGLYFLQLKIGERIYTKMVSKI